MWKLLADFICQGTNMLRVHRNCLYLCQVMNSAFLRTQPIRSNLQKAVSGEQFNSIIITGHKSQQKGDQRF